MAVSSASPGPRAGNAVDPLTTGLVGPALAGAAASPQGKEGDGGGAWLASIAPFEELFFDDNLIRGLTVREALAQLEGRYAGCRRLVTVDRMRKVKAVREARGGELRRIILDEVEHTVI